MKDRYSIVGKWEDNWFMELPVNSKLLFTYICDKCDASGIIEWNQKIWSLHTGLSKKEVLDALKPLNAKLISDKKTKLWVKTHLFWQRYLPLQVGVEEHDWIISRLNANFEKFGKPKEISDILEKIVYPEKKSNSKKPSVNFIAPKYDEFCNYYLSQNKNADEEDIKSLYDHYISCGWKVNNKPMKDWEAAVRNGIRRKKSEKKGFKSSGDGRTVAAIKASGNFVVEENE